MENLEHFTLVVQALLWGSLYDHFTSVFIARTSGKIVASASKACSGSHSCPYISVLLKLVQKVVAAGFATQLLTDRERARSPVKKSCRRTYLLIRRIIT